MKDLFRMLPKIMDQFGESDEFQQAIVFGAWKKAAGESLSSHTVPLKLKDKQLTIGVADNTWKRHLESFAGQMIFKLNSILGSATVTFIEFQIDAKRLEGMTNSLPKLELSKKESRKLAMNEVSDQLRVSAGAIADDNLRKRFLLAAGGCLARKKRMANSEE